ncbi:HigA family addiction module antitoxin [Nodosilinea sp. P-1105]|uniref:HigA family addiction module antitoxin n=1 Tax=Nodosilinea sp. P-1105 TaxID=2546229 RepID=UPI00146F3B86|nr:HigA family addiction module antitoxin [Nodosilinea sp. P-1105]NMF86253.1 addiction module antidote protein, HigA family [Nodosilinea sp. P-1105]
MRVPTHRPPTHPGEMLLEEFLVPMDLSAQALATSINVPAAKVEAVISGQQGLTPGLALRLAKFFAMSADFWLTLQLRWDLYQAQQEEAEALAQIHPYKAAS